VASVLSIAKFVQCLPHASAKFAIGTLEQDRFGWNGLASMATFRPKRESCSIQYVESKIHVP